MPQVGEVFNPYRLFNGVWIPNSVMRSRAISSGSKLCLGRLFQYAGEKGFCYPSQKTLATELAVSERRARFYLYELEKTGFIAKRKRGLGETDVYDFKWHSCYDS